MGRCAGADGWRKAQRGRRGAPCDDGDRGEIEFRITMEQCIADGGTMGSRLERHRLCSAYDVRVCVSSLIRFVLA